MRDHPIYDELSPMLRESPWSPELLEPRDFWEKPLPYTMRECLALVAPTQLMPVVEVSPDAQPV